MVTIVGFEKKKSAKGGSFIVLKVEGGVQSMYNEHTKKWYLGAMKCNIIAAVDEATCKNLIGSEISGTIVKKKCLPYSYTIPSSGKTITIAHRFVYEGSLQLTDEPILPLEALDLNMEA
jgi:hypothetical protein